ncbi:MAG: NAD-dependent epimerase/dehydratase family protein, partial [Acidimicrobiaceae bacterium]
HLDSENLVESAHKQEQIEGISLRNANGFGAPMSADAKIWQIIANDLCRQAVEKKKLTLKSHGQQYRNFIPFTDVCNAIKNCLFMSSNKIDSTTFNLGSDHTIKVLDLAHLIASRCSTTLGHTPEIQTLANPPETMPAKFHYDSSKLRATGIAIDTRLEHEVGGLLKACRGWFK